MNQKPSELTEDEILEQGSQIDADDVHRRIRRGDESAGDPNERDAAGAPHKSETPRGREETKSDPPARGETNG